MKIDINKVKVTPGDLGFNFCVWGELNESLKEWVEYWNLKTEKSGKFTNIMLNEDSNLKEMFNEAKAYQYVDGFSPNLNKNLHVGHLSNLVIANAFQKMGIGNKFISIFGDTLDGAVEKQEALENYYKYCGDFGYQVDEEYYASDMKIKDESILIEGEGDYTGSKAFEIDGQKIVGIKNTGNTTYFYQDVALAQELNADTLYLTGFEQNNHFNTLNKLYPTVNHVGLGLIFLNGKKMSSSEGNIIYLEEFINDMLKLFNNDIKLVYNILAGQILKSLPTGKKTIDTELLNNPKISYGLYLSYTMAHIKSCGVSTKEIEVYSSQELAYLDLKAKVNLMPNILLDGLVKHCKKINQLYEKHYITDNPENIEMFSTLISDLELGMKTLGMFSVDKV